MYVRVCIFMPLSIYFLQGTSHYGKENRYVDNSVPSYKKSYTVDPPRGNFSMYDTTPDTSQLQIRDDVSETDSERRMVKRKVLRYYKIYTCIIISVL